MMPRTVFVLLLVPELLTGCGRTASSDARPAPQPVAARPIADRLAGPVLIQVDGVPLVRDGYCTLVPFVGDVDGNGRRALLLGTSLPHDEGRLLIYRDVGTDGSARLSAPQWFDDAVPTGRIPRG